MTITSELVPYEEAAAPALRVPVLPDLPDVDSWIRAMSSIAKLAAQICNTSFVPKGLRGDEAAVTAAILTGRELGLGPMASLRHIHVVEGVPSLDAEYKRAKVQSLGHDFDIIEWDHEKCIVSGRRKGSRKPPLIVSYTIADARRAELVKPGSNYIKRPKVMTLARATTLICSALFSDVTNGLATTELLESGDPDAIADAIGSTIEMPAIEALPRVDAEQARARKHAAAAAAPDPSPAAPDAPPSSGPAATPNSPAEVAAAGEATISDLRAAVNQLLEQRGVGRLENRVRIAEHIAGKPGNSLTVQDAIRLRDTIEQMDAAAIDGVLAEITMADDPTADAGE